jgi:toxin ParE1/3/4
MEHQIVWSRRAFREFTDLHEYIAESNPSAADRQAEILLDSIDLLVAFPERGRAGRCPGTRELIVPGTPYIVAYRVRKSMIEVLAIIHTARLWPLRLLD